jgi:hypothetical protein
MKPSLVQRPSGFAWLSGAGLIALITTAFMGNRNRDSRLSANNGSLIGGEFGLACRRGGIVVIRESLSELAEGEQEQAQRRGAADRAQDLRQ